MAISGSQLAAIQALANASRNVTFPNDLTGQKKKLADSAAAIFNSNAPQSVKNQAGKVQSGSKDESALTRLLNVLGKPKTAVVAGVSRLVDDERNFLKDLRNNVGTADVLAKADWFKDLPTPVKIGIGITGDIALDPLTYIAPQSAISKIGGAAGLSRVAGEAAIAAKAAGAVDDAARLETIAGRLLMKGEGGIGGLSKADLAWVSEKAGKQLSDLGVKGGLKGGLYFNLPGTGRVGSYVSKKLTGEGFEPVQMFLGRPEVARRISAAAKNFESGVKTSKVMSNLSDTYGGGLGQMKRKILNAETPEQALAARRVLMSEQIKLGSESVFMKTMERRFTEINKLTSKAGVDPVRVAGALDGTVADIEYLDQVAPGLFNQVRELDNRLLTDSLEQLQRVVKKYGGSADDLKQLAEFQQDHFRGFLTDEARAAISGGSGVVSDPSKGIFGFMKQARYRPGADHMGVAISHPTQDLTRAVITDASGTQRTLLTADDLPAAVAGVDDAAAKAAVDSAGEVLEGSSLAKQRFVDENNLEKRLLSAERRAKKAKTPEELQAVQDELLRLQDLLRRSDEGMVNVRFYDDAGDIQTVQVPVSQIQTEVLPAGGVGAKSQVNQINRELFGYDLFDMDYNQVVQRQIREVSRALGAEVQGQVLRKYGLADVKGASVEELVGNDVVAAKAVAANADNPDAVALVAAATDAKNAARMDLPAEASDFSVLSLTPEQQIQHFDGVIAEVRARAEKLSRSSKSATPAKVKNIEQSILRTQVRLGLADNQLETLDQLIADAERLNAGMPQQIAVEPEKVLQPTLDAPEKSLVQMTSAELAEHEKSLDTQLGNFENMKSDLQTELENAEKYSDVASETRVSRQDLNDLRNEVKAEAGQVAEQMRAQVDAVGGRLESPWNSPGGEWDWWKQLSRSQQRTLRPYMGGGEAVRNGASSFGGAAVGRVSDGMGVDVFAEQWRQIRNLSPDANISEIMDDWVNHIFQMKDAEKVARGVGGYTSLVQDWMAPNVFGDPSRRLTPELLFPSERIGDRAIAENLSQHFAREFSAGNLPSRSVDDIRSELDQLEMRGEDLINQYQKAMDEYGRREALIASGQSGEPQVLIGNPDLLDVGELKAIREAIIVTKQADATALRMLDARRSDEIAYKAWMSSAEGMKGFEEELLNGWVSISRHTQAPQEIANLMALMIRNTGPDKLPGMFRYFDKLTNLFKSWAIATPGFVMRNGFGGMFNNYLIGVDPGRYRDFLKADRIFNKAVGRGLDVEQAFALIPARLRADYELVHTSGVLAETDRISDAAFGLQKNLGQGDQTRDAFGYLGNNPITRGVYDANSRMERVLRGAAGMDAAAKTKSLDGVYESVFKAHFDYADLNRFEVNVMKRVSPFYTWTRKNLPLQMEMLFKNPKAYNRYNIFKNNIEAMSPPEDLVPSWMSDRLNIRLPFQGPGGQAYILPDLPFTSLNMFTNADELAGQINPLIKLPAEMMMDRKLYFGKSAPFAEGFVPMHPVLTKTGIASAMGAVGLAQRDIDGNWVTRDKTLYAVEQLLPFYGRMRRLLPAEEKYNERAATTWLNFMFGTGLRTNTQTDQKSELYYRQQTLDKIAKDLNSLGYGGYSYWNKRVETTRKPTETDKRPYLSLNQPKGGLGPNSPYTNTVGAEKKRQNQKALEAVASRVSQQ